MPETWDAPASAGIQTTAGYGDASPKPLRGEDGGSGGIRHLSPFEAIR